MLEGENTFGVMSPDGLSILASLHCSRLAAHHADCIFTFIVFFNVVESKSTSTINTGVSHRPKSHLPTLYYLLTFDSDMHKCLLLPANI